MKTKLKHFTILFTLGIMMMGTTACEKYQDGPSISLRSRTERISNNWKVENYKINDADYTSLVADYTELFTKEGNYSYQWGAFSGSGTWTFQNNDEQVRIINSDQDTSTLFILKLEEKTFWYYQLDGDDKIEYHMIQQ